MRKLSVIISLLMLFLVGFVPTKGASSVMQPPQSGDSLAIRRAVELTTDAQKRAHIYNDTRGGDSLLRLSIAWDSSYAPAYFALAQSLQSQRSHTDSVIYYARKAYLLDSTNKWYNDFYAQSLALGGQFEASRELYAKAIEREPQNPNPYVMVAMLYRQTQQPHEALAVLDSAEVRTGTNSYISSLKREMLLATGQSERAIQEAQAAAIDPDDLEAKLILSELYILTKQDSLAESTYRAAMKTDSTSVELLGTVSQFYLDRGNMPGYFLAIKHLFRSEQESLERKISLFKRITSDRNFYGQNLYSISELATQLYLQDPTNKEVVELYAQHLIASGNIDQALELYKSKVEDPEPQKDYYTSIIDIESYLQRADYVELYTKRALAIFPDHYDFHLSRANFYSYTQNYTRANELYRETIKIVPTDSLKGAIWGIMGDNYHQLSLEQKVGSSKAKAQMRKAYKAYEESLKLYARNAMVLNNYAYFLSLEKRDLERALDMSGRAVALNEGNSTYLDTYAWILFELGRLEEAKKIMRQVIALDTSESADIQFHYAEILAALGENFMAEIYYDKALKLGFDSAVIEYKKSKLK